MTEQRRLAAILVADVVGYSKLVGSDEAGTLAQLEALRREIIEAQIAKHAGRLFKSVGDGYLIEFSSAVQAVSCAKAIQEANGEGRLPLRIGIHVGDVVVQGDDLMGDGVNVAARVEGVAEPGGIAITRAVHEQVRDKLDLGFMDKGEIELKNIQRPVQVFVIGNSKGDAQTTALTLPDKPSIAVLPFQNMSGDPEQEYFADGIVEDLVTALSRFQQFFVIARNSSFTYKGRAVDVRQVGRELGVRYVLEGSVRKAGNRVRITGQLVDSLSGAHLWADRFDGAVEDVFDLQDRITVAVAGVLPITIQQAEIDRVIARKTSSPGAYDSYLLGMKYFYVSARQSLDAALKHFYRAIELDDEYVEPHAWASILYTRRKQAQWMGDMRAECEEGVRLGRRAVELRPDHPLALGAAGFALAYLAGETAAGLDFIDRSLALNRNDALTWHGSGWARCYNGDYEVAIEHIERAERLSPVDPQSWQFQLAKCLGHFGAGRYEMAVGLARTVIQRHPNEPAGYIHLARSAALAGQLEEARLAMARALELNPALSLRRDALVPVIRKNEDRDRLIKAYRLAGMPE
jgi:adenylate cyclase